MSGVPATEAPLPRTTPQLRTALTLLRVGTASLFIAHAAVRVLTAGSLQQFGEFMTRTGVPAGVAVVWMITVFELVGGSLMLLGIGTRVLAAGFIGMLIVGIALIHRHFGWFVGEHGTGGSEYSVALMFALVVIAAADASGADRRVWPRRAA
jgi:putative oxidoreductase